MSYDTARPHIASYVVFRKESKVAFVLRSNTNWMNGFYGLIAGKVENDESFRAAAIREAKEEAGVEITPEQLETILVVHRNDPESNVSYWVDTYFEVTEWEGELTNAEPTVHSELAWLDPNDLPENVIPAVRFALEQITNGKIYAEYGW